MFANAIQSLASNSLPLNWFDAVVILVLGFGLFRGRKNGMSKELLPLFQWLAVVFVCGLFYSMVAQLLVQWAHLDPLTGYLVGYVILALAVFFVFSLIKRTLGLKLFGSNIFGNAEYYLGMPSGLVRFACMLFFALALLNARQYTTAQIEASNNYQDRWYGAHFFPDLFNVQNQVFKKSLTGPYIKDYLSVLMIKPTPTGASGKLPVQDAPVQ
jgi:Colicin V production protein